MSSVSDLPVTENDKNSKVPWYKSSRGVVIIVSTILVLAVGSYFLFYFTWRESKKGVETENISNNNSVLEKSNESLVKDIKEVKVQNSSDADSNDSSDGDSSDEESVVSGPTTSATSEVQESFQSTTTPLQSNVSYEHEFFYIESKLTDYTRDDTLKSFNTNPPKMTGFDALSNVTYVGNNIFYSIGKRRNSFKRKSIMSFDMTEKDSKPVEILNFEKSFYKFSVSSDGKSIFIQNFKQTEYEIFDLNENGEWIKRELENNEMGPQCDNPVFSKDKQFIIFRKCEYPALYKLKIGESEESAEELMITDAFMIYFISPDAQYFIYTNRNVKNGQKDYIAKCDNPNDSHEIDFGGKRGSIFKIYKWTNDGFYFDNRNELMKYSYENNKVEPILDKDGKIITVKSF